MFWCRIQPFCCCCLEGSNQPPHFRWSVSPDRLIRPLDGLRFIRRSENCRTLEGLIDINIYFTYIAAGSELQVESVEKEAALRSIRSRHIVGAHTDNVGDIPCRNDIIEWAHHSKNHSVVRLLDRKLKMKFISCLIRRSNTWSRTHHCANLVALG